MPDREFDQHVLSLTIGDRVTSQPRFDLLCSDRRGLDNGAARIHHRSSDAARDLLCRNIQACQKCHHNNVTLFALGMLLPIRPHELQIDFAKQFLGASENARDNSPTD